MITYNGGSISNVLRKIDSGTIFVTDTRERAVRYANAQATGVVSPSLTQELAEGGVILSIECSPTFIRRPDSHTTLDVCEAITNEFRVVAVEVRPHAYPTLYGDRGALKTAAEAVAILNGLVK